MSSTDSNSSSSANTHQPQIGIVLILLSMFIFAAQDGITKYLVKDLPIAQLVMVRYGFFLAFAIIFVSFNGGLAHAARSTKPLLQSVRSLLAIFEIMVFGMALKYMGLAETHAIYAVFPLLTIALAGLLLKESVSSAQWLTAGVGFIGTAIILQPGTSVFSPASLIPLMAALMFAVFSIISRKIGNSDSFGTNMLHMGFWGALTSTLVGLPQWVTPTLTQALLMITLSITGVAAQMLMVQAFKYAPVVTLQPFNYTLLVFASLIGVIWLGERLTPSLLTGSLLVVAGGLVSLRLLKSSK